MTCPVCHDAGVVTVKVYCGIGLFKEQDRPCSAPNCLVANVNRIYRAMEPR